MSAWLEGVQYAEQIGVNEALRQLKFEGDDFQNRNFVDGVKDYTEYYKNVLQPIEKQKEAKNG